MGTAYNWAGDAMSGIRLWWIRESSLANSGVFIPTDIRDWLSCTGSEVITNALQEIGLPSAREAGTFDIRAWRIWDYVANLYNI